MRICAAIVALAVAVIAGGCGGSAGTDTTTGSSPENRNVASTTKTDQEPRYPVPQAPPQQGALKKLVVKNLRRGSGPVARWGDEVHVRYVGLVYQNGEIYSQHWKGVDPLDFKLDHESVGIGWQKGIEGMRVGGWRELQIPKRLLFNDEDVAYVVEVVGVDHRSNPGSFAQEGPFAAIDWKKGKEKPHLDPPDRPAPGKLLFRDLKVGASPTAQPGDEVSILYTGFVYKTGEPRYGGSAGPFRLGSGGLGEAFERGLVGMEAGGRRELIVPSRLLGGTPAIDYGILMKTVSPAGAGS